MCIGRGRGSVQPKPTFRDAPPVVTGSQTGVDNPKDTERATELLKIKRQKREGTYVDPNLTVLEDSLTTGSSLTRAQRARGLTSGSGDRTAARNRAQTMARNRLKNKYKSSPTGRRTGTA